MDTLFPRVHVVPKNKCYFSFCTDQWYLLFWAWVSHYLSFWSKLMNLDAIYPKTEACLPLMTAILCRRVTLSRTPWWGDWRGVTRCLWAGLCSQAPVPQVTRPPAQVVTILLSVQELTLFTALHSEAPHFSPVCVWPQVLSVPQVPEFPSWWPAQAPHTLCCSLGPPGHWCLGPSCPATAIKANKTGSGDGALTDTGRDTSTFMRLQLMKLRNYPHFSLIYDDHIEIIWDYRL